MSGFENNASVLGQEIKLPCGAFLKNRLVKSAMSDSLGDGAGNSTEHQARLYEKWAQGGVALAIIGEVQVDGRFPEKPGNLVLWQGADMQGLRLLTQKGTLNNAHIWPQLGHAGALAYAQVSQPKGPAPIDVEGLRCEGMSLEDVQALPATYARAAAIAKEAGFTGLQIHAGHGFLLSQFLSPLFNRREDEYGGSVQNRSKLIVQIIEKVRSVVGADFPIGIKINASDQLEGGLTEDDSLEVIRLLDCTSIDLIEISGGTYFPGAKAASDKSSAGPYFTEFSRRARALTTVPLVVTGGFKSCDEAETALVDGAADLVEIARGMVLDTELPNHWLSGLRRYPEFPNFSAPLPGGITAWYSMRMTAIGEDNEANYALSPAAAIDRYETRDTERGRLWRECFPI